LARLDAVSIDDLVPYPIITYLPQALLRQHLNAFLKRPLNIRFEVATSMTGIVLAFHGAGVALVESGLLAALPVHNLTSRPLIPEIQVRSHVLWSSLRPQTALSRSFVQHRTASEARPCASCTASSPVRRRIVPSLPAPTAQPVFTWWRPSGTRPNRDTPPGRRAFRHTLKPSR